MAETKLPKFHSIQDAVNQKPKKQFIGLEGYEARFNAKLEDKKNTEAWLDDELGVKTHIDTAKDNLTMLDHYAQMPEVTIEPDIKEFFETNKSSLDDLNTKIKEQKSEYMSAYRDWQDLVESMDEKRRSYLGLSYDFDHQEEQQRHQIKTSKEQMKSARQSLRDAKNEADPLKAIIGRIAGTDSKSIHKVRDARRQLRNAKISFNEAKRRLKEIQERRENRQDGMEKLQGKEYAALSKMSTALANMETHRQGADKIAANMKKVQSKLVEQYKVIDQYRAIQEFKNSPQYAATKETLKLTNRALHDKLESIPESLPPKTFAITLTGPLQVLSNNDKIAEVSQKIEALKGKLPEAIKLPENLNSGKVQDQIDILKIRPGEDSAKNFKEQLDEMADPTREGHNPDYKESSEYKMLKMKIDYMTISHKVNVKQIAVDNKQEEINNLMTEYNNATDSKTQQATLAKLQQPKEDLKKLKEDLKLVQEELARCPYSRTLRELNELKNSLEEKEQLKSVRDIGSLVSSTSQALERSPIMMADNTNRIAEFFKTRLTHVRESLEKRLNLPEPEQSQDERSEDEGR